MAEEYTLEDLEKLSGLPIRTLRFYIQEGLLPGPDTRGKFARYSGKHLNTIELIQRMKNMRIPLQKIKQLIDGMSTDDLANVMRSPYYAIPDLEFKLMSPDFSESSHDGIETPMPGSPILRNEQRKLGFRDNSPQVYSSAAMSPPGSKSQPNQKNSRQVEETWQRIRLADGLELQVRKPLDRHMSRLVEELRRMASLFFEDSRDKDENDREEDL